MSFGISDTDRQLLDWVKDNKDRIDAMKREESIPTATAVEMYDDSKLKTQVDKLDKRLSFMEEEEKKEKPYFERVEQSVEANKSAINMLGGIISKNAIGAKNAREALRKAMKSAQDKQQKEISERMEAMRNEFEKKQEESNEMLEETKGMLGTMRGLEYQLNRKITDVLNAKSKVFTKSTKRG